jgi:hypothetical protein
MMPRFTADTTIPDQSSACAAAAAQWRPRRSDPDKWNWNWNWNWHWGPEDAQGGLKRVDEDGDGIGIQNIS